MDRGYKKEKGGSTRDSLKRESPYPDYHISNPRQNSRAQGEAKRQRRDGQLKADPSGQLRPKQELRQNYSNRPLKSDPNSRTFKTEPKTEPKFEEVASLPKKPERIKTEVIVLESDDGEVVLDETNDADNLSNEDYIALQEEAFRFKEEIELCRREHDEKAPEYTRLTEKRDTNRDKFLKETAKQPKWDKSIKNREEEQQGHLQTSNRWKEETGSLQTETKEVKETIAERLKVVKDLTEESVDMKARLNSMQQEYEESGIVHSDLQAVHTETQRKVEELDQRLYQLQRDLQAERNAINVAEGKSHSARVQSSKERNQKLTIVKQERTSVSERIATCKREIKIMRKLLEEYQRMVQRQKDYPNEAFGEANEKQRAKVKMEQ